MIASAAQIKTGVLDYAMTQLLPKFDPPKQFLAGTAMGVLGEKTEAIITDLAKMPVMRRLGVVTENGSVDIDVLLKAAKEQMQMQGSLPIEIPLIGKITFNESDLRELYNAISNQ